MPMKYVYTQAKGKTFKVPYTTSRVTSRYTNEEINRISNMFTAKEAEDIANNWFEEYQRMQSEEKLDDIIKAITEERSKSLKWTEERKERFNEFLKKNFNEDNFYDLLKGIVKYNNEGICNNRLVEDA